MDIFNIIGSAVDTTVFGPKKNKKVSPKDIKKWRGSLSSELPPHKRDRFEAIFGGLDKKGIPEKIDWLEKNPSKHTFTEPEIKAIKKLINPKD